MDGRITSRAGDPKSAARQHVSTGAIPHTSCPIPPPDIRRLETADQPPVWVRRRSAAGGKPPISRRFGSAAEQPPVEIGGQSGLIFSTIYLSVPCVLFLTVLTCFSWLVVDRGRYHRDGRCQPRLDRVVLRPKLVVE